MTSIQKLLRHQGFLLFFMSKDYARGMNDRKNFS